MGKRRVTDKELKRLSRTELLELLTEMSSELDRIREERDQLKKELEDKEIRIAKAGSIADAALSLSRIFEATQKAADLYLMNVKAGSEGQRGKGN